MLFTDEVGNGHETVGWFRSDGRGVYADGCNVKAMFNLEDAILNLLGRIRKKDRAECGDPRSIGKQLREPVNRKERRVWPIVRERLQLSDALARYLGQLGLERRKPPAEDLTAYIEATYSDGGDDGDTQAALPLKEEGRPPKEPPLSRLCLFG